MKPLFPEWLIGAVQTRRSPQPSKRLQGELKLVTENFYYLALVVGVFAVFAVTLAYYSSNTGR